MTCLAALRSTDVSNARGVDARFPEMFDHADWDFGDVTAAGTPVVLRSGAKRWPAARDSFPSFIRKYFSADEHFYFDVAENVTAEFTFVRLCFTFTNGAEFTFVRLFFT